MQLPIQKIVVPTDFSDLSLEAVDSALQLAGGDASRLHIVSVLVPVVPPSPGIVWGTIDDQVRLSRVREALEDILGKRGLSGATAHVLIGTPGTMVTELAHELNADLIVVTSHGRTGIVRAALGSVAERVVRLARCPVLVIKKSDD
jgi:nucleotide-binding universal stress UspA family protein